VANREKPQRTGDPNQLLDIGQAAAFLNVSETSLRRWTNSGHLPCLRVGQRRERRFRREDLLAFLEDEPSFIKAATGDPGRVNIGKVPVSAMTVTHGDHLCGLYASDLGRIMLAVPFLLEGLHEGSACFLVAAAPVRKDIVKHLTKKRPSLQADIDAARLSFWEYPGSSREQFKYFRQSMDDSAAKGAQSFRVLGDVWGFRARLSAESVAAYEAGYDRLIVPKYPAVTMCLYDVRKFSGMEVLTALKGHRGKFRYPLQKMPA
jgi:transcriptional repressor of dcmA and dcmR